MKQMLGYGQVKLAITGVSPLIVHNGQLCDPMNKIVKSLKQVTSKRKKVDADLEEMARLEFLGSLYLKDSKPVIPGEVMEACLVSGAKKSKSGVQAKAGMFIEETIPIIYDGPKDPIELWNDERFRIVAGVKVGQARVMRTRPKFNDWRLEFTVSYLEELLNPKDVFEFAKVAGIQCGLCDWRPRFGRFVAEMM